MVSPKMPNALLRDYAERHPLVVTDRTMRNVTGIVVDAAIGIGQAVDMLARRMRDPTPEPRRFQRESPILLRGTTR